MDFYEFLEAYGADWDEDDRKCAECLWMSSLLREGHEAEYAAQVLEARAAIFGEEAVKKYRQANSLRYASYIADSARSKADGRSFGEE